jgi:DNA-binding response OmpR family regulator
MTEPPPAILVVDDDKDVRATIVGLLQEAGLGVTTASSGWAALDALERAKFDLVVVDIGLPGGLDGLELIRCVRARSPTLKCLFISGLSEPVVDDPDRDDFVAKPFRPYELLGCVWELLQRPLATPPLDWGIRQAERSLLAAEIDCRRNQRIAERLAEPKRCCAGGRQKR